MCINCKTYFSFRFGTFATSELVELAVDKGVTSLALTNINNTYDSWEFVKLCREHSVQPIVGTEIRNGDQMLYILLAKNNEGLKAINDFLSDHLIQEKEFPSVFPEALATNLFVIYPLGYRNPDQLSPHERLGVKATQLHQLTRFDYRDQEHRMVILQPVTFQNKTYHSLHRLMRSIDKNILLSQLKIEVQASEDEVFYTPANLLAKFKSHPKIVMNTYKLMDECTIEMEFYQDKTKRTYSGSKEDDRILLEKLALDGFKQRYGLKNKSAFERLNKELKIIDNLGFNSYFLINWDMVRYAQGRGFYHVGRGSGANSIVAYSLYMTDVDPIELNLYFERFLNPHRTSPPDFDIDFSWTDRDEVMDYVFKRYGKD
jgi:DNA polymerase-3 subunit alpha